LKKKKEFTSLELKKKTLNLLLTFFWRNFIRYLQGKIDSFILSSGIKEYSKHQDKSRQINLLFL